MYELREYEYRQLDNFPGTPRYVTDERLLRYRRNVVVLGGVTLLLYFAGISFAKISVIGIEGGIQRPQFVPHFLELVFLYNFWMFNVVLRKELANHVWVSSDPDVFARALALFVARREMRDEIAKVEDATYAMGWSPKRASSMGSSNDGATVQFELDPEVARARGESILAKEGFTLDGSVARFEYRLSDADRAFFSRHNDQLRNLTAFEFMDLKFPIVFGCGVTFGITAMQTVALAV